jgi:DHA2 family multidrug resistance protein
MAYQTFRMQGAVLGYMDIFAYCAILAFCALPLTFLLGGGKSGGAGAAV